MKVISTDPDPVLYFYTNGNIARKEYYINGKLHRANGPAIINYYDDGSIMHEEYYINGKYYDDIFKWSVAVGSL